MRISRGWCFTILATLLAGASSSSGQDATEKRLIPADAAVAEATKLIKEVYGSEWAAAKTPADKQTLAKKLVGKASATKDDPTSQFALLKMAMEIAMQLGDGETAYQAIDAMADTFEIDALKMKMTALTNFASVAQKLPQHKTIAEEALKLVDQAVSRDNFTLANDLGKLGVAEARKALDKKLVAQAEGQAVEATELAKAYEDVKTARVKLAKTPDDPEANLVAGKYLCFVKGDWENGLPMLAFGKDDALKALAAKDLAGVESSSDRAKLGDGWWDLAEKQSGTAKRQLQARAVYWYRQALPGLTGLAKDKVEKRAELVKADPPLQANKQPVPSGWVKIVNRKTGWIMFYINIPKRLEAAGDYFKIRCQNSGQFLGVQDWAKNGAEVGSGGEIGVLQLAKDAGDQSIFWKVEYRGNGFWSIANRQTGKYLEVREADRNVVRHSTFRAGDPAQEWRFEAVK